MRVLGDIKLVQACRQDFEIETSQVEAAGRVDWRALAASLCPGALLTRMPIIILARYLNARVFVDLLRKGQMIVVLKR